MTAAAPLAALLSICLLGSGLVPGVGEVRRTSLLGYRLPSGEVLDIDEAAARASALATLALRPGLVRLPPSTPEDAPDDEIEPDTATARLDGRRVRVWVNEREIGRWSRPCSDSEALGVVCALSDIFPTLNDRQRQEALVLFDIATRKPSPALRRQALAQWKLGATNAAFDARMDGASPADEDAVIARWGAPASGGAS